LHLDDNGVKLSSLKRNTAIVDQGGIVSIQFAGLKAITSSGNR
jgi:hypothetical protein